MSADDQKPTEQPSVNEEGTMTREEAANDRKASASKRSKAAAASTEKPATKKKKAAPAAPDEAATDVAKSDTPAGAPEADSAEVKEKPARKAPAKKKAAPVPEAETDADVKPAPKARRAARKPAEAEPAPAVTEPVAQAVPAKSTATAKPAAEEPAPKAKRAARKPAEPEPAPTDAKPVAQAEPAPSTATVKPTAEPAKPATPAKPAPAAPAAAWAPVKEEAPPDPRIVAATETAQRLKSALDEHLGEGAVEEAGLAHMHPMIRLAKAHWADAVRFLKTHLDWKLNYVECMVGTDYADYIEVLIYIQSTELNHFVCLKTRTDRDGAEVPSLVDVHPGVNWEEREIYDLLGVTFTNHPDLRRIMMWDDFTGHPLRKDYNEWDSR